MSGPRAAFKGRSRTGSCSPAGETIQPKPPEPELLTRPLAPWKLNAHEPATGRPLAEPPNEEMAIAKLLRNRDAPNDPETPRSDSPACLRRNAANASSSSGR